MSRKTVVFLITGIVMIAAFAFVIYQDNLELERLKALSETYAKENESLKIDNEMLRKKLAAADTKSADSKINEFAYQQQKKFKAMKDEIWNFMLAGTQAFIDVELTKRLASFGFKPEETAICVEEYKDAIGKSTDILLQWYRNEISDSEYTEKLFDISREFYKNLSESVGDNLASITLSVVLPDYGFRKKMFEEE